MNLSESFSMKYKAKFYILCKNYPKRRPLNFLDWIYSPETLYDFYRYNDDWKFFWKNKDNDGAKVVFHRKKLIIEVSMSHYYTGLYRDLLYMIANYPQCIKASKKSLEWINKMSLY